MYIEKDKKRVEVTLEPKHFKVNPDGSVELLKNSNVCDVVPVEEQYHRDNEIEGFRWRPNPYTLQYKEGKYTCEVRLTKWEEES